MSPLSEPIGSEREEIGREGVEKIKHSQHDEHSHRGNKNVPIVGTDRERAGGNRRGIKDQGLMQWEGNMSKAMFRLASTSKVDQPSPTPTAVELEFGMFDIATPEEGPAALASLLISFFRVAILFLDIPPVVYEKLDEGNRSRGTTWPIHVEEAHLGMILSRGGIPFFQLITPPIQRIKVDTLLLCYGTATGIWRVEYELFRQEGDAHCRVANDEAKTFMVLRIPREHVDLLPSAERLRRMIKHADRRTAQILDTRVIAEMLAQTHLQSHPRI
ncbi:hypothetical protein C8R43DRAFT_946397 [Mycena crocata]|nr:hypothetical protein C8R43DRAFT_946397 [Mycena crocata]